MILAIGKIKTYSNDTRTPVKFNYDIITGITAAIDNNGNVLADFTCPDETHALKHWRETKHVSIDQVCA